MVNRKGGKKHKRNKAQGQLTKVLHQRRRTRICPSNWRERKL